MESAVADPISPPNKSSLSSPPLPSFTDEPRPRRRVRTLLSNHSEDSSKDAGNNIKSNFHAPLRPKVRKSATLKVDSKSSTFSLHSSNEKIQSLSSRDTNLTNSIPSSQTSSSSYVPKKNSKNKASDPKAAHGLMTKKGYDVNLVRQYMKRKRKENKFIDHQELLKDIFKPLHHVCSPPRPSTPPKEVKQKVKHFIAKRKKNEKRNAFLQSRAMEEEKKKRKDLLAALDKERRLKLQAEIQLIQQARSKKRPLVHEKIASAFKLTSNDDKLRIAQMNSTDSQTSAKKKDIFNKHSHTASLNLQNESKTQLPVESENERNKNSPLLNLEFQTHVQERDHPIYFNRNEKDRVNTSSIPRDHSFQSPLKNDRSPYKYHSFLASPTSHNPSVDSTISSIPSMQIPTPSSATYGSVHSTLDLDEVSEHSLSPTELFTSQQKFDSSDLDFQSSSPSPIIDAKMDHAKACSYPQASDYYSPFRIYSRLVNTHSTQDRAPSPSSDPGIHHLFSEFVDLTNTDFKKILGESKKISSPREQIDERSIKTLGNIDEFKTIPSYITKDEFRTESTSSESSPSPLAPVIKSITVSPTLPFENVLSSKNKPSRLPSSSDETAKLSLEKIASTYSIQENPVPEKLKENKNHEDSLNIHPSFCKLTSSSTGICTNNDTCNQCNDKLVQTDPFFEKNSTIHLSSLFRSELKKLVEEEIQAMLQVYLSPFIQEVEQKLETLQRRAHSVISAANEVRSNPPDIIDQQPVHWKKGFIPLPCSPLPVSKNYKINIPNLSPVHKPQSHEQEVTFLSNCDITVSTYPCILPTPYEETYISTNAGATIDSNSIFDFSQLEDTSSSNSCIKLDIPLTVLDAQNMKLDLEAYRERDHLDFQNPSACQKETLTNMQSSLGFSIEEELVHESMERSCTGLAIGLSQTNLQTYNSPILDDEIRDDNFNPSEGIRQESELVLPELPIEEESRVKSSPISSQGFDCTEVLYSDTFISESISFSKESNDEALCQQPILQNLSHSSIDDISTKQNIANLDAFQVFTEEIHCQSSDVSLSLHTESILNTSALSLLSPTTSIQGAILDSEAMKIEECEDSEVFTKKEKEKLNSFVREKNLTLFKNENRHRQQEANEQKISSTLIETQESMAEINFLRTCSDPVSLSIKEKEPSIYNESIISNYFESILSSIEAKKNETDQNLTVNEVIESVPNSFKDLVEIQMKIERMNSDSLSESHSAFISCIDEQLENASHSFTGESAHSSLKSRISHLVSGDSNKYAYLLEETNGLAYDENCLSDSHFSLSSILNTRLSLNSEIEENANFNLDHDASLILLHCDEKQAFLKNSNIHPIHLMTPNFPLDKLFDMDFSNKEEVQAIIDGAVNELIQIMIQETANSVLGADTNATIHLPQYKDMEYAEQYIKFLLLHHYSSISKETKIEPLPHPLFIDTEYNHLLVNIVREFQSECFRRPGPFSWQEKSIPTCIFYRSLLRKIKLKPKTIDDRIASEIQREHDSIHLIDFASFFENKIEYAVTELLDQLITEATFF